MRGGETMGKAGDQPVVGERRRRREAERAAALAAEQAGVATPLTRREVRRRQLEEEARLEAIATGELQLGPAGTYELRQAAREAALRAEVPAAESDSAAGASPASGATGGSAFETATTVSGPSADSGAIATSRSGTTAVSGPSADSGAIATSQSGTTAVSGSSADSGAIATGAPSRRSVRDRLDGPAERPDDASAARDATATGRRPVVRTPTSVTGIRRLDATGQLTGIQPAARPDDEPQHPLSGGATAAAATTTGIQRAVDRPQTVGRPTDANTGTSDPVQWDDAVTGVGEIIAVSPASARPDRGSQTSPSSPISPSSPASPSGIATADSPEEPDDLLLRPQWVAISSVSGASADEAVGSTSRRSQRRAGGAPETLEREEHDDEEHPGPNMVATLVKIVTLALVAAIIGALIWLLATEAFDDGANGATPIRTIPTLTEETSAS